MRRLQLFRAAETPHPARRTLGAAVPSRRGSRCAIPACVTTACTRCGRRASTSVWLAWLTALRMRAAWFVTGIPAVLASRAERACLPRSTTSSSASRGQHYIANRTIATVVYLASRAARSRSWSKGPPASARPSSPRCSPRALGHELIRLQCYEGLDEAKALYEWEYAKQLLYTQILQGQDRRGDRRRRIAARGRRAHRERGRRLLQRALHPAAPAPAGDHVAEQPCVLLIDEIDKSDTEFEAFLLEMLSDFQVSVPELGTIKAAPHPARRPHQQQRPRDVGRAQAALPAPLHRLPGPGAGARHRHSSRCPASPSGWRARSCRVVQRIRKLDLKKVPSISETLDWARALMLLNVETLDERAGRRTRCRPSSSTRATSARRSRS